MREFPIARLKASLGGTETWLGFVVLALCLLLSLTTHTFLTWSNLFDILNVSAVNIIFAMGLLVVLIAGGIDISFAVGASVTQYLTVLALGQIGGGNWMLGMVTAMLIGAGLGSINAAIIFHFRIVSIVVTIGTFNVFFGLLMFLTGGVSLYDLPDWLTNQVILLHISNAAELDLPVLVMGGTVVATWLLLNRCFLGRQLFAMGDNVDGARRLGVPIGAMHYLAFGWLGMLAGIAGLMQAHYAQEVVPNALYGRELDVLAATVLGGARLGGGRGSVLGTILGVALVAITANGLNLLGISPFAFKMIVGGVILVAITISSEKFARLFAQQHKRAAA